MSELRQVLESFGFAIDDIEPQPLRGLSNRNYLVRSLGTDYVVRIACEHEEHFGINREAEKQVLHLASAAGLGAELIHFALPEGHSITRALLAKEVGQAPEKYRSPEMLRRITLAVKRIHSLPAIVHSFDPIARIRAAFRRAQEERVPLPEGFHRVLIRLDEIETRRGRLLPEHRALCHNDLFGGNILDCRPVRFIDWEFAGMGDVFFDLATLAVACDEFSPLPEDLLHVILEAYTGSVNAVHMERLEDMILVVQLHVIAWGMTHHVMRTPQPGWEGFTFLGFATDLLSHLLANIDK